MAKKKLKKGPRKIVLVIFLILLGFIAFETYQYFYQKNLKRTPKEIHESYYFSRTFGLLDVKSQYDYNNNDIDDYTDILKGSIKYAELNPDYISKYYDGGYPPDTEGVCTDTIWYALKEAGYLLKDMMEHDIRIRRNAYDIPIVDDNIDFRRVGNQLAFFEEYAESLSTDINDIATFMPGDILVFDDGEHIAMVSNKRNALGIPYLIQNRDETQTEKEEDRLIDNDMKVTGHFRMTYSEKLQGLIDKI